MRALFVLHPQRAMCQSTGRAAMSHDDGESDDGEHDDTSYIDRHSVGGRGDGPDAGSDSDVR